MSPISHDKFIELKNKIMENLTANKPATQGFFKRRVDVTSSLNPPPLNIGFSEIGACPERKVLYRNFHEVSGQMYLIEISKHLCRLFVHLIPNFETPKINLQMFLPMKVAIRLLLQSDNKFASFV